MRPLKPRTIAEILAEKTPEEREEWLQKDAIQEAASSEIEGLPIPSEMILEEFKKCRFHGV